jgi:hypothetical protein
MCSSAPASAGLWEDAHDNACAALTTAALLVGACSRQCRCDGSVGATAR